MLMNIILLFLHIIKNVKAGVVFQTNFWKHYQIFAILPFFYVCYFISNAHIYLKLCDWHYIYLITVFLYCAFVIISHNNEIVTF